MGFLSAYGTGYAAPVGAGYPGCGWYGGWWWILIIIIVLFILFVPFWWGGFGYPGVGYGTPAYY